MPDLGIVTISMNQKPYLGRALESVLSSDVAVEYVVVDAGSTDGSRDLISSHEDRLAAIVFEPDRGPADGLNKGMARLSSPVLGYLNADDFYLPGALAEVMDFFDEHPEVDVVLGHGLIVDPDDRTLRRMRSTSFTPRRYARGASLAMQQSTFFRREVFERVAGFNTANETCWDAELLMDMALAGAHVRKVDRYWGAFRYHEDSITVSGRLRDKYAADQARLMAKGLGREPRRRDHWLARVGRVDKWLRHPSTVVVRLGDHLIHRR